MDWTRVSVVDGSGNSSTKDPIIFTNSISSISAFTGFDGQILNVTDPNYFNPPTFKLQWESALSAWIPVESQLLKLNYPTSGNYWYTFFATSADQGTTNDILIGTIPANIIYSNRIAINCDAFVEADKGNSSTLSFKFGVSGTSLPTGASFATTAACNRSMLNSFVAGIQCEGSSAIADKIRVLGWGNSSGISATRSVDFTQDVNVYAQILNVTSGVNYGFRRSHIKIGTI